MEENQYLMWMKRKQELKSHILQAPFFEGNNSSWEERAFAEDAARILGGCIWPPRSYNCNFCKREFRSAQALGGHMNVHRRDRARLKQSLSSSNHHHHHNHNHHDNDDDEESSSLNDHHHHHHKINNQQFSSAAENNNFSHQQIDICKFLVNNPNCFSSNSISGTVITTSKISNQEELFHHENMSHIWGQKMMVSPDSEQKGRLVVYASRESQISNKGLMISYNNNDCVVETSLSVGLNSVIGQKFPNDYSCAVVEEDTSYKKPKTDSSMSSSSNSLHSVFIKPCPNDKRCLNNNFHHHESAEFVLGIKPGMEDLDLELRLGKPQKA